MRPFSTRFAARLPMALWAAFLSICLFFAWPASGEAHTRLAEPTPATQPASPLVAARSAESPTLPKVLARRTFGPSDKTLVDLVLDPDMKRLYAADGGGSLHVLDAATLEPIGELPVSGLLTLDDEQHRLYVAPGDEYRLDEEAPHVTVIDTQSLEVVGEIPDARFISLDSAHGRIFAGNPLRMTEPQDRGLRVYAADTLEQVAESDIAGIPVYDSEADQLLVVAYTVSVVDPTTLTVTRDLMPDLSEQPFQWCNGCERAWNASVHPDDGIVVVQMTRTTTGGVGFPPASRIFDARITGRANRRGFAAENSADVRITDSALMAARR